MIIPPPHDYQSTLSYWEKILLLFIAYAMYISNKKKKTFCETVKDKGNSLKKYAKKEYDYLYSSMYNLGKSHAKVLKS